MGMPRTTIVGGRPPGSPDPFANMPVGIETLVKQAIMERENTERFINDPLAFALEHKIKLDPAEESILRIVDKEQLIAMVHQFQPKIPGRRNFLRAAAGLIGVLGTSLTGGLTVRKARAEADPVPLSGPGAGLQQEIVSAGILPSGQLPPAVLNMLSPERMPSGTPTSYGIQPTETPTPTMQSPTATMDPPTPAGICTEPPTPTYPTEPPPTETQTPTLTPAGISPTPTQTYVGTTTPEPSSTPTPTPTTECTATGAYIQMPSHFFRPGDLFNLKVHLCNADSEMVEIPLFVILQVGNLFYCAPDWKQVPELSYYVIDVPSGWTTMEIIGDFFWPQGVGEMQNMFFWAGMTTKELDAAFGQVDSWKFGYGESA